MSTASALAALRARALVPANPLRGAFGPLEVRNYRLYVISQVLTNTFGWASRIAQNWLILTLTGSTALVGLTVAFQFAPSVFFGLQGGVVADRYPRRTVLAVTQSIFGLTTLAVGLLALTERVEAWHVLAAALVTGTAIAYDNPSRQAFVNDVAGPQHLRSAIGLNSAVFQLGGLVGPAVAGVLIGAFGEAPTFLLNALACFVAVALLVAMRPDELTPTATVARARGQLREGLAYALRTPATRWATLLIGAVALTGINMTTVLAAFTDDVFRDGAGGYALLTSMLAVGGVIGALAATRRHRIRMRHLVVLAALIGAIQLALAPLSSRVPFVVLLVVLGTVSLVYLTGSNALVQTVVPDELRGRVLALYLLVLLGAQAASGVIIGWVSEQAGAHVAMAVGASGPLLGAAVVAWGAARSGGLTPRDVVGRQAGWRSSSPGRGSGATSEPEAELGTEAEPTGTAGVPAAVEVPAAVSVPAAAVGCSSCSEVPAPRRTSATPATTSAAPTS